MTAAASRDLLTAQKQVLEQIVRGDELEAILTTLVSIIEQNSDQSARASVLLTDSSGKRLLHGAAPSLPEAYNAAIHGITVGPRVGSCGTAVYRKESVLVSNIATDPLWEDFSELAPLPWPASVLVHPDLFHRWTRSRNLCSLL